jgi:formate hydrogenlyase subunit 3/multisubunit Na+/H+ antiporter MnhD subunit
MVGPIYIVVALLGAAFLLPLFERAKGAWSTWITLLALALAVWVPGRWLYAFMWNGAPAAQVFTAGFAPPLSINLLLGPAEAFVLLLANLAMLAGALYLRRTLAELGVRAHVLVLLLALGASGIVMTRDLFNLFVFMEIAAISSYALVGMERGAGALAAGFKYAVAGSIASIFMLLGIILLYAVTGTLNIDGMIGTGGAAGAAGAAGATGAIGLFMLMLAMLVEMKQFPANGWALDVYEAAHPGVSAFLSATASGAVLFAVYKLLPVAGTAWAATAAAVGMATFVASNVMGLRQRGATRLLGYSSVGQMGLLLAVIGLGASGAIDERRFMFVAGALFFNHLAAKAGLYWIAGIVRRERVADWRGLGGRTSLLVPFGIFVLALLGFPPFAGFWGKWDLVVSLAGSGSYVMIGALLLGSLLEAAYLLRWLGVAADRGPAEAAEAAAGGATGAGPAAGTGPAAGAGPAAGQAIPVVLFALISAAVGISLVWRLVPAASLLMPVPLMRPAFVNFIVLAAALALAALRRLPERLKGVLALAAIGALAYLVVPESTGLSLFFTLLFLGGGFVLLAASLYRHRNSAGYYPLAFLMIGSLVGIAIADTLLQFFFAWELMTVSSYLLILRGRNAREAALRYALFSLGGAFLLLAGLALAEASGLAAPGLEALSTMRAGAPAAFALIALGFLVKIAGIGLHVWAPGAYAEAEDGVSPLLSGILSKAGILGFVVLFARMGFGFAGADAMYTALGWIGALTAFFATLYAVFQEDAKRLLAWSSVGQVGYILLALSAMSHLGWVAALWHAVNHLLFKGLLFLAVAGVIYRTGTRRMYEMGGLIKRMPLSYISVMIGIIALSGVPPLSGFGGKWLLYNALIERGWYLQTALALLSSTVAFLYCFRLIHAIFLGQPKPRFRDVREAPMAFIVPQYVLIVGIMLISVLPGLLAKRLSAIVGPIFPANLHWSGFTAASPFGYWNATAVMMTVGAIFVIMLAFLLLYGPRPQKVKQFNIVYAGERPETPETTHYAFRFFRPYEAAMSPLLRPLVKSFWAGVEEWALTIGGALRQIYTGNAQTYALFIFLFGVLLYALNAGVSR